MMKLLRASELTPEQRRYVELADDSAGSLLALINDLLDLGKIEAGKVDVEQLPFRLDELLEQLGDMYTLRAREKGLAFELDIESGLPRTVAGDAGRLRQILNNLLSNALKFTEPDTSASPSRARPPAGGATWCASPCTTPASASPKRRSSGCSRASARPTVRPPAATAAADWARHRQAAVRAAGGQPAPDQRGGARLLVPLRAAAAGGAGGAAQRPARTGHGPVRPVKVGRILVAEDNPTNQVVSAACWRRPAGTT
jgi:hypothetical protein